MEQIKQLGGLRDAGVLTRMISRRRKPTLTGSEMNVAVIAARVAMRVDGTARFCPQCGGAFWRAAVAPVTPYYSLGCNTCGGDGSRLPGEKCVLPRAVAAARLAGLPNAGRCFVCGGSTRTR